MTLEARLKKAHEIYDFSNNCFMCRIPLDASNRSDEHVFPQWLQGKYNLRTYRMSIPYDNKLSYGRYLVPCCKKCNNEKMSHWENHIKRALQEGYDGLVKLDENIIAWWLTKIYYGNIIKELTVRKEVKNPESDMITDISMFKNHYNNIYFLLYELFIETKFEGHKLYELYIFQTNGDMEFDYLDDTYKDVILIKLNDIVILCSYISGDEVKATYEKYVEALKKQEIIDYYQVLELWARMHYAKSCFHTIYVLAVDDEQANELVKVDMKSFQTKTWNYSDLHTTIRMVLQSRGYPKDLSSLEINEPITIELLDEESNDELPNSLENKKVMIQFD